MTEKSNDPADQPDASTEEALRKAQLALTTGAPASLSPEEITSLLRLIGKTPESIAYVRGQGAVAQGAHSTSIGAGASQVRGTVEGDFIAAGAVKTVFASNVTPSVESLRSAYLNRVIETAGNLSLAGIDPKAATELDPRLSLNAVYIGLDTTTTRLAEVRKKRSTQELLPFDIEQEAAPAVSRFVQVVRLPAVEVVSRSHRIVLLGDPGSGKSTFLNFLACCLAGEIVGRPDINLASLQQSVGKSRTAELTWKSGAVLPVRIILRDFAARGLPASGTRATAEHVWQFIAAELKDASLEDFIAPLRHELLSTKTILLLDGLDEVADPSVRRVQIREAISDFASTFRDCHIVATSRTYAYERQDWRLPGFTQAQLAPFNKAQISSFVQRWYAHVGVMRGVAQSDTRGRAEVLRRAIVGSDRLFGLAQRPLLLTLMASLHAWRGGSLPEKREELYADTVNLLLDWWEGPKTIRDASGKLIHAQLSLAEWLKLDRDKVRDFLNECAFNAHIGQESDLHDTADIPEAQLIHGLVKLSNNPDVNPVRLVDYLSQRAGLLIPRAAEVYAFPHRTFQEYLAACYLTDHDYPERLAEIARRDPTRWREVTVLAGAKAARGTPSAVWLLIDALCHLDPLDVSAGLEDAWGAFLAALLLIETVDLAHIAPRRSANVNRVRNWLVVILKRGLLPASARAEVGDCLAFLGDSRFESLWGFPEDAMAGFTYVPAGNYLVGDIDPLRAVGLPAAVVGMPAFYIGIYPVTVQQFRVFCRLSNYQSPHFQPEENPHYPATGVTWFDAKAFTNWLDSSLRSSSNTPRSLADLLASGWRIDLPSEFEWEAAAKGREGLSYPWGQVYDAELTHRAVGRPVAKLSVGCLREANSSFGVSDLVSNVWQWTRSVWSTAYPVSDLDNSYQGDSAAAVMKGGPDSSIRSTRCSNRVGGRLMNHSRVRGFRLVLRRPTDNVTVSTENEAVKLFTAATLERGDYDF